MPAAIFAAGTIKGDIDLEKSNKKEKLKLTDITKSFPGVNRIYPNMHTDRNLFI
jgi:hypothetical protein